MDTNHRKREFIFWGTGTLLLAGIIVFLIYSIGFLVNNTSDVLGKDVSGSSQIIGFNLDGLEKLGLTQKNQ